MKLLAALGVSLVGAGLAIPASDSFTRANGALGATWTAQSTAFQLQIAFNEVETTASGTLEYVCTAWNTATDTFSANQSSQARIANAASDSVTALTVRTSGNTDSGTWSGYAINARGPFAGPSMLDKSVSGVLTELVDLSAQTWATNDIVKLEASGTTITAYKNGVSIASVVDSSLSTGQPGFCLYGGSFGERVDDWTGDNLGGGTPPASSGKFLLLGVGHP